MYRTRIKYQKRCRDEALYVYCHQYIIPTLFVGTPYPYIVLIFSIFEVLEIELLILERKCLV